MSDYRTSMPTTEHVRASNGADSVPSIALHLDDLPGLLSALPYLTGFVPSGEIAVVAADQHRQIDYGLVRALPTSADELPDMVGTLTRILTTRHVPTVALLGYGTADQVTPIITTVHQALDAAGIQVAAAARVEGSRYWPYTLPPGETDPTTDTDGIALDPDASLIAIISQGLGMPKPGTRAELAASIAPLTGPEREAMREATATAVQQIHQWLEKTDEPPFGWFVDEFTPLLETAIDTYGSRGRLTDADAARLSVLLVHPCLRDIALAAIRLDQLPAHRALWADLTRRSVVATAACASLLAFTSWLQGNGALADLAVTRALEADPAYDLAHTMREVVAAGMSPHDPPGTATTPDGDAHSA